jgi:hypothetical protein
LFAAYRRYEDGFLPSVGAVGDQPALLIQAFDQITFAKSVLDDEDLKKDNEEPPDSNGGNWQSVRQR